MGTEKVGFEVGEGVVSEGGIGHREACDCRTVSSLGAESLAVARLRSPTLRLCEGGGEEGDGVLEGDGEGSSAAVGDGTEGMEGKRAIGRLRVLKNQDKARCWRGSRKRREHV